MTRSDPLRATSAITTKALTRTLLVGLFGLLCLSNVFVQGQGTNIDPSATPATGTPTGPATGTVTGTASGTVTGTATGTATGVPITTTTPTQSRSPADPLASLTMLNPKANSKDPPLFPLGVDLPFSWDISNNLKLPIANLTIEAYLPDNTIITIANAIAGSSRNYTWPAASQKNVTNPIKTGLYTIRIYDGNVGRNGYLPDGGGYLATYSILKIGLYIPSDYVPGYQMHRKLFEILLSSFSTP
ncbi:hypothetical protein EC991_000382 [Linnemannia zychae]|nr:hypothetical protein EC991_000382 [Linnemannia zychae]